ncbi:efflux RND transporter permease subunit [Halomonas sp. A11-A]|uniref:efflux RND transporter permease subunit n=1 Tax=Halomonas sp. A11-A TaxID=2183985 RepID=UPI000D713867|nr:efflux RND transporter permease subunit [Halomonas sp. A11-A]PWV76750.1 AcrB/AcrD/AcrF family protein [Halomonas sp. A11-A]
MIRWFAAHPTAANLLLILLLAAGLFAAPHLKRETFPDYRPVEVSVEVVYRGASAADVEDAICRRLFDAVKGVEFLDEFGCVAQDNLASATATMAAGGDAIRFLSEIDTEVSAITELPARADPPVVRELHRSDLVAAVAVSGEMPRRQLEDYALRLEERIMTLPGVARVAIHGMSRRQWQVEVPREVLGQHGLSAWELARRVAGQSLDLPLGTLETADRDLLLRFTDQRRSPAELAELVVVSDAGGGELTLGELATITEAGERAEEQVRFNGEPALVLEVSKALRDDALTVKERLESLLEAERRRFDGGVSLTLTQDATSIVRDRLQMLVGNGLMGLVLVVLVMSLFFRPRLALWAVLGLPAAFMGAFIVMALTGLSLNMITLVALLMAIGIVMDDAIVITDNIAAHAGEEATPLEAVVSGTRQVLPGVLSSFLTTVAVFAPLSFLAGELGAVLGLVLAIILGSAGFMAGGHLGSEAMPDIEGDVLEARILMPQGTPLERTEAVAERIETAMRELDARLSPQQPGGAALVEAIQVRFNHNLSAREAGPHVATVIVDLLTAERRRVPLEVVANAEERREWARITRIDGRRTVTVEANVDARRASGQAIVDDLVGSGWLEDFGARHPEVAVSFEGQVASSAETGGSIGRGLLIGLVGIFVILSFQFRSYVEPLIVMLSIPLAFIGAIWGHVLMGYYLSMPSLIGAASLAGIVVNNAILLIHFIKTHRERGLDAVTAAGQASRDRLRAILISSITTIAGLLPLLAETSTQAAAIKPLVISVVFGLLSATVLVLLVIPALYVLLDDWGWVVAGERPATAS